MLIWAKKVSFRSDSLEVFFCLIFYWRNFLSSSSFPRSSCTPCALCCISFFFYVFQTVVVETEVSLCRHLATWTQSDTMLGFLFLSFLKLLPTLCQPSQKLTGGWSGRNRSRLRLEPGLIQFHFEGCTRMSFYLKLSCTIKNLSGFVCPEKDLFPCLFLQSLSWHLDLSQQEKWFAWDLCKFAYFVLINPKLSTGTEEKIN